MEQDSSEQEKIAKKDMLEKVNSTIDRFLSYVEGNGAETIMHTSIALDLFEDLMGDSFEPMGEGNSWKVDSLVRYGKAIREGKTFRSIHIIISPNNEDKKPTSLLFSSADGEEPGFTFIEHLSPLENGKPNNRIILNSDADLNALNCINRAINSPYGVFRVVMES